MTIPALTLLDPQPTGGPIPVGKMYSYSRETVENRFYCFHFDAPSSDHLRIRFCRFEQFPPTEFTDIWNLDVDISSMQLGTLTTHLNNGATWVNDTALQAIVNTIRVSPTCIKQIGETNLSYNFHIRTTTRLAYFIMASGSIIANSIALTAPDSFSTLNDTIWLPDNCIATAIGLGHDAYNFSNYFLTVTFANINSAGSITQHVSQSLVIHMDVTKGETVNGSVQSFGLHVTNSYVFNTYTVKYHVLLTRQGSMAVFTTTYSVGGSAYASFAGTFQKTGELYYTLAVPSGGEIKYFWGGYYIATDADHHIYIYSINDGGVPLVQLPDYLVDDIPANNADYDYYKTLVEYTTLFPLPL